MGRKNRCRFKSAYKRLSQRLAAAFLGFALALALPAMAAGPPSEVTLIKNVNIFDCTSEKLPEGSGVLVDRNLIKQIAKSIKTPDGATVIDGGGRTLMPGLTDAHWHVRYAGLHSLDQLRTEETDYTDALKIREAGKGFTTVRDLAGGGYGLKKALDEGQASLADHERWQDLQEHALNKEGNYEINFRTIQDFAPVL